MSGLGCGLAEEEFEEFFFDGGVEAANEGDGGGEWPAMLRRGCGVLGAVG